MLIIGLTGSIGMGKSAAAGFFRAQGVSVFDSDAEVHRLYAGEAVPLIEPAFPGTTRQLPDGGAEVDRTALAKALMTDTAGFKTLEKIVHPMVYQAEKAFLRAAMTAGAQMAVLEIPLLFEGGREKRVDVTVVVSAPAEMQRARVLARPGMTPEKLETILARQTPDAEKRQHADFVVDTAKTIPETQAQIDRIVEQLQGRSGTAYAAYWS